MFMFDLTFVWSTHPEFEIFCKTRPCDVLKNSCVEVFPSFIDTEYQVWGSGVQIQTAKIVLVELWPMKVTELREVSAYLVKT